jgi:polyphosphate:AMP phosphotransferase
MLETLDLKARLGNKACREAMDRLELELPIRHRAILEHGIPVLVLFEGWFSSGRGDSIGQLVHHLDPRATRVHVTHASSEEDRRRPWPWRFWRRTPARGRIEVFDRSWYYLLWNQRDEGTLDAARWERELQAVGEFERQLVDDGTALVKCWLHIGPGEQKRRLKAWAKDETQRWRVSDEDWKRHRAYPRRLALAEEMLARTHTHRAPWTLIEAEDENHRRVRVLAAVAEAMRHALEQRGIPVPTPELLPDAAEAGHPLEPIVVADPLKVPPPIPPDSPLARVDLSCRLERDEYAKRLKKAQARLRELEFLCYSRRLPAVVVFEGWDAAGKGGAIRRLTESLDPRGYAVVPIAAPTAAEKAHHYLWRFWNEIPKDGHWAIFDRSWYGRVLVERVEGFASEAEWRRAYQEINEFERALVSHGTVVVKFWLHISPEEQLARFRRREQSPLRRHKITAEDWRNRGKWPPYLAAVSDMLRQTSTTHAPWTVVEANDKLWARVKVVETVIRAIEARL